MIKGYAKNICAGVVGFTSNTKIEDIIEIANKLSSLKKFKRIIIKRTSVNCWGIDAIFKREKTSNKEPASKEIIPIIKKRFPKIRIKEYGFSGEVIQIKPKVIK